MKISLGRFEVEPFACHCAEHKGERRTATVEVEVDPEALVRLMGRSAMHNKSRFSAEAGGRVVVKVVA